MVACFFREGTLRMRNLSSSSSYWGESGILEEIEDENEDEFAYKKTKHY